MSRKQLFIAVTAGLLALFTIVFYLTGRNNSGESNSLDLSVAEEDVLIADMQELDSLFGELENAGIKGNPNTALQMNISWEKSQNRFLAKHQDNQASSQIAKLILENYRSRIEVINKMRNAQSAASTKAERIKEAILEEQAKNDALKTDNILLKEALLKL